MLRVNATRAVAQDVDFSRKKHRQKLCLFRPLPKVTIEREEGVITRPPINAERLTSGVVILAI